MQIIKLAERREVSSIPDASVIAFGFFDGVHIGHRHLIETAKKLSRGIHPITIWTFDSIPKIPSRSLLMTNEEKCGALRECGADYVVFEDFENVRGMSGEDFFREKIYMKYKPYYVVCGFNFRFGANASSSADDMCSYAEKHGVGCAIVPPVEADGLLVSSSEVRKKLSMGDMRGAAAILGHPYSITADVTNGQQIGRKIGRPTANQRFPAEKLIPPCGVYSCIAEFSENGTVTVKGGVCNIGSRPTVNCNMADINLETYILDYTGELYGKNLRVSFVEMLRCERKFNSLAELSAQIAKDENAARKSLADCGLMK